MIENGVEGCDCHRSQHVSFVFTSLIARLRSAKFAGIDMKPIHISQNNNKRYFWWQRSCQGPCLWFTACVQEQILTSLLTCIIPSLQCIMSCVNIKVQSHSSDHTWTCALWAVSPCAPKETNHMSI